MNQAIEPLRWHNLRKKPDSRKYNFHLAKLNMSEKMLLELICLGNTSKEIAYKLNLSTRTVANHIGQIHAKLGSKNIADAVRIAIIERHVRLPGMEG